MEFSSDCGHLFPEMYGIMVLRRRAAKDKPLHGAKIACCTHVTAQTAVSHLLIWPFSFSFSSKGMVIRYLSNVLNIYNTWWFVHGFHQMPTIVSAVQHSIRNWLRLIGVDFGGPPKCAPLTIEQCPCIYQFLPYFPPTKFGFSPNIFHKSMPMLRLPIKMSWQFSSFYRFYSLYLVQYCPTFLTPLPA